MHIAISSRSVTAATPMPLVPGTIGGGAAVSGERACARIWVGACARTHTGRRGRRIIARDVGRLGHARACDAGMLLAPPPPTRCPSAPTRSSTTTSASRSTAPAKQLTGRQRVTWRNPSTDTVADLWFHLYLNAFSNTRSTFWKESGGELRGFSDRGGRLGLHRHHLADARRRHRPHARACASRRRTMAMPTIGRWRA